MLGRLFTENLRLRAARRNPAHQTAPVASHMEGLEDRRLMSADPLAHVTRIQPLPLVLEFDAPVDGLHDRDGQDIGLTRVQVNKNGQAASYLPANLDLRTDLGVLQVTTTGTAIAGTNYNNDNTQTNALETQFDATTRGFAITTRLRGPLGYLDHYSEQGGIFFGPDQDNYVKLVASVTTEQHIQRIEFADETYSGSGTVYTHQLASKTDVGPFSAINTLDLRLEGDATTGTVKAYYSINGATYVKVNEELVVPDAKRPAFFNAAGRAGLITAHKNDVAPVTVAYDRFEIQPGERVAVNRPRVVNTRPGAGATDVPRDGYIAADLLLPNGGVNSETLSSATVRLIRTRDGAPVAGEPGTTGGGDQIIFTPASLLEANTEYRFEVTDGVQDSTGAAFVPFSMTFTTASATPQIDPTLSFEKIALPNTAGLRFTAVKVGPDNKLYAGVVDGRIIRYPINADGTLGTGQTITSLQTANGGNRLLTGFAFDPAGNASNVILWVTHGQYAFGETEEDYADDWTSKITRMSGTNLATVEDKVINLPRSARDHLTNQPSFGPVENDGKRYLYVPQGSNTSMGAPDVAWGQRIERDLSGAVLRLDPAAPLVDAMTSDGGGSYDPFAPGAPLTIYATGVRNAYDLVWTRDGRLYAPTNGSAAGGSTPYGPGNNPPPLTAVPTTQHDFLFRIDRGGHYGHPNPTRAQYVLNGGYTPDNGVGVDEIAEYGLATGGAAINPDANYRGYAWDFGLNISPNGAIEYQNSQAFGGMLSGRLLVTRYSGPGDIAILSRNSDGSIRSQNTGVAGLKGFVDPIDVTEDVASGNLYVADYGQRNGAARKIYLLRPIPPGANLALDRERLVFSDVTTAAGHAGASPNVALRLTNTGTVPLAFPDGAVRVVDDPAEAGDDSSLFRIVNGAALPDTLGVGESFDVLVNFTAGAVGIESAFLRIQSNDSNKPTHDVPLRGVGVPGTGGDKEPSLARILRAHQIPTIVGDGDNDSGEATTTYPMPPDDSSQEVLMPRLVKAGAGPVTVEVLAAEAINTEPSVRFGYYTPGNRGADARTELFTISAADAQSLQARPNGRTSFDPGASAFGLYSTYPGFKDATKDGGLPRAVFSEDALNLWEGNASNRHKVRYFPLRQANGTVVPNAFVVAFEEFDNGNDYNDIVAIVRNVRAAPAGAEIGLENLDGAPFTDRLAMNKIQDFTNDDRADNRFHDVATLRVRNTGTADLVFGATPVATTGNFAVVNPPAAGARIAPGASLDLQVRFTATSRTAGDVQNGTLTLNTNDADEAATVVQLSGFWQSRNEGGQEPSLQELLNTFGYATQVVKPGETLNQGGRIVRVGDEVLSPYWLRADGSAPVTVRQISAFHTQGNVAALYWHNKGSTTVTNLFTHDGEWGQSFLPPKNGTSGATPSYALFNPSGPFGWRVDGKEWSDPTKNPVPVDQPQDEGHHLRFWVVRDRSGAIVPNAYILTMDYAGINYDYNDNTYLITNVRPENPPTAPRTLSASGGSAGVALDWADNTEANLGGYNVYRAAASTGPWARINAGAPVTASEFTDAFAPTGTSFYRVTAVDLNGTESAPSAVATATRGSDTTAPARPAGLVAKPAASGITLDWTDNTESDLGGYNVFRSASATGPWTKLNTSGLLRTSSFVDITAPTGSVSYYQVVAVDLSANASSAATVSATRPAGTAPAAPTNVSATATGPTAISVSWTASGGATSYRLERQGPGSSSFVEIASNLTGTSYADSTGLSAGNTYVYRVRAENGSGTSAYSATASATTPTNQVPPAAPATLDAAPVSAGRIDVTWAASAGATSYRLERQGPNDAGFAAIATGLTATSYQDTAVVANTTYAYRVRAENGAGPSGYSPTDSATTPPVAATGYTGNNIGNVSPAGSLTVVQAGTAYDVRGGGTDVIGTNDRFYFAHRQVTGDFDMKVRLASFTPVHEWAKAGLMARAGLAANAANVFVLATPGIKGYRMTYRSLTGGTTLPRGSGAVSYPNTWIRLRRLGNTFLGYRSTDGRNWALVHMASVTMPRTLYFGMAVASNTTSQLATAQFRDLGPTGTQTPTAPAAPASLAASAASATRINLSWAASSGATQYAVERRPQGSTTFQEIGRVTGTTYADTTGLTAGGTYTYRVRAINSAGMSPYSPLATATTPTSTAPALTGLDIGGPTPAGSTTELVRGRDYNITAGGSDVALAHDRFHYAYRQVTGDFDVKVRVQSVIQRDLYTKAGIMARANLNANSANVFALLMPSEMGHRLTSRATDGALQTSLGSGPTTFPGWLRLRRVGDNFTAFRSTDGVTWTPITTRTVTVDMPDTIYLGLAVTSHNNSQTTTAEFRDFGNV